MKVNQAKGAVWRKWIRRKGIPWTARHLRCDVETPRAWVNYQQQPKDIMKCRLVDLG